MDIFLDASALLLGLFLISPFGTSAVRAVETQGPARHAFVLGTLVGSVALLGLRLLLDGS
ncbi:MAG: hypothetical protein ACREL7_08855 [Longimicrobiales bacterium]